MSIIRRILNLTFNKCYLYEPKIITEHQETLRLLQITTPNNSSVYIIGDDETDDETINNNESDDETWVETDDENDKDEENINMTVLMEPFNNISIYQVHNPLLVQQ